MLYKNCNNCLFGETCAPDVSSTTSICEHYSPIDEDVIDQDLVELSMLTRNEFSEAWRDYVFNFFD